MGECLIIRSGGGTDTSDATVTSDVVLSGYTCYVNDELVTGSMVAQNPGNQSLTPGGEYTIKEGYYDGTDEISVTSLSDNTSANATAGYILTGYNAWVNGSNVSGSMANQGNVSQSLAANGSYTIPAGWHAGGGRVTQSLSVHVGGTYTPNTANQVICWANWYASGNIVVAGASTLTAGNIRNGVNIFGVTGNFSGWVDDRSSWVVWPKASMQYPNVLSPTYYTYLQQSQPGIVSSATLWNVQPYISGWNTFWLRFTPDGTGIFYIYLYNSAGGSRFCTYSTTYHSELSIAMWFNNPGASNSFGMSSSDITRIEFYSRVWFGFDTFWLQYGLT